MLLLPRVCFSLLPWFKGWGMLMMGIDRAAVDAFHKAGIAAGGKDNGEPGLRPYAPGYYAAFVIDPAGNNIEVVYMDDA